MRVNSRLLEALRVELINHRSHEDVRKVLEALLDLLIIAAIEEEDK